MDASRYFDAMHNAMSTLHAGAQLLLTIRLQDTCGNDAYLEVKQLPGEQSALVCYSTMGRRCLNFQLFRKGWQLCHNADGQLTGRFPSSADSLLSQTDFRAYCREDRLDAARTQRRDRLMLVHDSDVIDGFAARTGIRHIFKISRHMFLTIHIIWKISVLRQNPPGVRHHPSDSCDIFVMVIFILFS